MDSINGDNSSSDSGTLAQRTVQQITDYIHEHDLRAGDQIPSEGEFGKLFGVSRSVTREAFKTLSALQIIDIGGGRRARVGSLDGSNFATFFYHGVRIHQFSIQQVWDARRSIELRAVELACLHRTEREADHLVSLAEQMAVSGGDAGKNTRIDIEFHNAIAEYSRNPLFAVMVSSLTTMMYDTNPIVSRIRTTEESQREIIDLHVEIAAAIKERDVKRVTAAMSRHFEVATMGFASSGLSYLSS